MSELKDMPGEIWCYRQPYEKTSGAWSLRREKTIFRKNRPNDPPRTKYIRADLAQRDGWKKIESAPSNEPVIVYCNKIVGEAVQKYEDWMDEPEWWWANLDSEYGERIYPRKWQSLPAPPTDEAEDG